MTDQEILDTVSSVLRDLLQDQSIVLTPSTMRADVPGWDSFAYVNFIVAVETQLGVRFRLADVESFQTVGEIVNEIKALKG
jgi:acyl carrier protein